MLSLRGSGHSGEFICPNFRHIFVDTYSELVLILALVNGKRQVEMPIQS